MKTQSIICDYCDETYHLESDSSDAEPQFKQQIPVYGFTRDALKIFSEHKKTINEQYEDPYAEQARQSKIEVRQSWFRALFAGMVGAGLMFSERTGILPELSSSTQFYGVSTQLFWFGVALICLFTMWFSGRNYYITAIK